MNKTVKHILAGLLAVLGFSSCSSLREAREARAERERQAFEAQQRALVEETLQEMLERDASDPELQARKALEAREKAQEMERVRIEQEERVKLLYAVPNAPYREIKTK